MRRFIWMASVVLATMALTARADVWDAGDNEQAEAQNELIHGSEQWHDLSALDGTAPDVDWFRIGQNPYASYEIVVDAAAPGLLPGLSLDRVASSGSVLEIGAGISSLGSSRRLSWQNGTANAITGEYIRVSGAACGSSCTLEGIYRIRAYETTYSIPRFNNSGTQVTVLLVQNPRPYSITGTIWFWRSDGTLVLGQPFSVAGRQLLVLATSSISALQNVSGSITLIHDGGYGALSGKAVALEPATGYSFDTPMVPLPR